RAEPRRRPVRRGAPRPGPRAPPGRLRRRDGEAARGVHRPPRRDAAPAAPRGLCGGGRPLRGAPRRAPPARPAADDRRPRGDAPADARAARAPPGRGRTRGARERVAGRACVGTAPPDPPPPPPPGPPPPPPAPP